jgi:hypothetical protein
MKAMTEKRWAKARKGAANRTTGSEERGVTLSIRHSAKRLRKTRLMRTFHTALSSDNPDGDKDYMINTR